MHFMLQSSNLQNNVELFSFIGIILPGQYNILRAAPYDYFALYVCTFKRSNTCMFKYAVIR